MRYFIFFFHTKPLKAGMSFTVMTSLKVDKPHFNDLVATDSLWLAYWPVQDCIVAFATPFLSIVHTHDLFQEFSTSLFTPGH